MKRVVLILFALICAGNSFAQESGNAAYGTTRRKNTGVTTGNLYSVEPKDSVISTFLEANVLMNVKADEYLAVFGVAQEGPTLLECNRKIDSQIAEFTKSLQELGVAGKDLFIDFVTQNRVYDFAVSAGSSTAREKATGFEIKKNILVHYNERGLLEKMLIAASKSSIFDLIKVDYLVNDSAALREKLFEEASKIIKRKEERYSRQLGIKPHSFLVAQEKYDMFFPSEMYNSYTAYETGSVDSGREMRIVEKRKSKTFYYNPLDVSDFDQVINPLVLEPVVQLTLYLKVKYERSPAN
jgi:uncharacterized protein YggE